MPKHFFVQPPEIVFLLAMLQVKEQEVEGVYEEDVEEEEVLGNESW